VTARRQTYQHVLRVFGRPPLRGSLRTVRADGDRELLPVRGCGTWRGGRFETDEEGGQ
jgi:hypothetical protein